MADDRLLVRVPGRPETAIDISGFDSAREVYGVTGALSDDGQEWLALLVQLRSTSGRELLVILNPDGAVVYEELLAPGGGAVPRVGLAAAGPAAGPQEIVLDRGMAMRYSSQAAPGGGR